MPAHLVETRREDGYLVSDDPARLDLETIHSYLARAYWSVGIPFEIIARAVSNSLCFGLYAPEGEQVGLARFVTDKATFAYLCDVYVLEDHRGRGLGRWLLEIALAHPDLVGLRRLLLMTRDAHELYRRVGFRSLEKPQNAMEIHHSDIYRVT